VVGDHYSNPGRLPTDHKRWFRHPEEGPVELTGCGDAEGWGCNEEGYYQWYLDHIPHLAGESNGHPNNWWPLIARPGCYTEEW